MACNKYFKYIFNLPKEGNALTKQVTYVKIRKIKGETYETGRTSNAYKF